MMTLLQSAPRRALGALLLTALCAVPGASAQTAADLFDDTRLHTLEIVMHSRDWSDLHANFLTNDRYPCDVIWNGIRMRNTAVRSRGSGSRYQAKPGLELSFDHYAARQRFLGLRSLVLDNLVTDPSMIRESVAMALLRLMGVPAPREAPTRVFVNGAFAGVYMMVEPVDTVFAEKSFGEPGRLFEYHWLSPFFATFPGEDLDLYEPMFESRDIEPRSIAELYTPMREMFRAISDTPDGSFDQVDRYLDLNGVIRAVAAESFMAEWDGLLGYDGMNNFYLYRVGDQARYIPWDRDQAFHALDYPLLPRANENVLMRRLLEDPALRAAYFASVTATVASATAGNWLEAEFVRQYSVLREAALADPFKIATNDEFEQAFAGLIRFARTRPGFVLNEVARLR
jgi:spore coat protein CotH